MGKEHKVHIIAHKGASAYYPENTLLAFEKAVEMGADMVEIDVRMSRDGSVVVIHDERVMTSQGAEKVSDLDLTAIEAVRLDGGEHIPTLSEVTAELRGTCGFYLDLKDMRALESTIKILQERQCTADAVIGSSDPSAIERIKRLDDRIRTSLLVRLEDIDDIFVLGAQVRPDYLHPCWESFIGDSSSLLTEEFFMKAQEGNYGVVTWHEEEKEELMRLALLPVYGICTDRPDMLSKILQTMERR